MWWWRAKDPLWQHSPRVRLFRMFCILIEFDNVGPTAGVSPWDTSRGDSLNARGTIGLAELFPSQGRGRNKGQNEVRSG